MHLVSSRNLDALYVLASRRGLRVVEDAALVIGSQWKGQNVGAIGDLVVFSFHPNKNMTTIEGGALVLNDDAEAKRVAAKLAADVGFDPVDLGPLSASRLLEPQLKVALQRH